MDGAAKFNQRDSLATILITAINIIAGLAIGVLQQGTDLMTAVKTYTILTVGDGLVTMIPSLLVTVAGAMVLTRASSAGQLDTELKTQLFARRNSLWIVCGVLVVMAAVPGMPKVAFLLMAAAMGMLARRVPEEAAVTDAADALPDGRKTAGGAATAGLAPSNNLAGLLKMDDLTLEIGFQLISLVDEKQGGQMLTRVRGLRRQLATELGFIVPPVHITDNLRLKPREYVVSLRGTEIGRWQTEQNCVLAVNSDPKARPIAGTATQEPAFGVAARWIAPGLEEQALAAGYSVVDQTTVIATHVGELIRRNAQELLGRQEVKRLLDAMNESHPKLVEELVPKLMTLGEVQKVLQQLLREQVSIRDLGAILEVLVEAAAQSKSTVYLVEAVRQAIGRSLVHPLLDADGGLRVLVLASGLEQEIVGTFDPESASRLLGDGTRPAPAAFLRRIVESVKQLTGGGPLSALPVLLVPSPARYHMRRWLEPFLPKVTVLSPAEIPPMVRVRSVGTIG
jgi:flagellar biosynthesis protein FlhA